MSTSYAARRDRFIAANPGYADLIPDQAPTRPEVRRLSRAELRRCLRAPANNQAEVLFLIGWGDGTIIRSVLEDPQLRRKKIHQILIAGEEDAFAASLVDFDVFGLLESHSIDLSRLASTDQVEAWTGGRYSRHDIIPSLAGADLVHEHPVGVAVQPVRQAIVTELRRALTDRPQLYGNDIVDTFTGLYQAARNAPVILPGPNCDEFAGLHGAVPVISIGAGPSVRDHLDRLRKLQDRCILVACDSALKGLLAAGIEPHYCTPIERVPEILPKVEGVTLNRCRFAGLPLLTAEVMAAFDGCEHLAVWGGDDLYRWLDPEHRGQVMTGSSTGVLATSVAAALGRGPVYLIGHDLAMADGASHWAAAEASASDFEKLVASGFGQGPVDSGNAQRLVPGNGGGLLPSIGWWDRFRHELALLGQALAAKDRSLINVNAATGVGAVIPGTVAALLPDPAELPLATPCPLPRPSKDRLSAWRERARHLATDSDAFVTAMQCVARDLHAELRRSPTGWDLPGLARRVDTTAAVSEGNRLAFKYVLRSALHNSSAEFHRQRRRADKVGADAACLRVMASLAEAMAGALGRLRPLIQEIVDVAEA